MDAPVDVAILGHASMLPGPLSPAKGELEHLGSARLLPAGARRPTEIVERLTREARGAETAPAHLATRNPIDAGSTTAVRVGDSPVHGLLSTAAGVAAVNTGQTCVVVAVAILDALATRAPGPLPPAEGGAALCLAPAGVAGFGPRRRVLLGSESAGIGEAALTLCSHLHGRPGDPCSIISATTDVDVQAQEATVLSRWFPETEILQLAWRIGDAGPALGLLAVLAALEEEDAALVLASDARRSCAVMIC